MMFGGKDMLHVAVEWFTIVRNTFGINQIVLRDFCLYI